MDSVSDDKALLKWADLAFDLTLEEGESIEAFRDRFAFHLLDQDDPIAAAEIVLGKPFPSWTPMECAKWVLDYEDWFATTPSKRYGEWCYLRDKFQAEIDKLTFVDRRRAGMITSNPLETLTLDGQHAKDVGKWDPSRQGRLTHWDRAILKDAPHGFEEAIRKREMFPTDDPDQGPLLIRHVEADGKSEVRHIVPKRDPLPNLRSLFPERRVVQFTSDAPTLSSPATPKETPKG